MQESILRESDLLKMHKVSDSNGSNARSLKSKYWTLTEKIKMWVYDFKLVKSLVLDYFFNTREKEERFWEIYK